MSSPFAVARQFDTSHGRMTNLDRCHKCGAPRAVHGADWSCPAPPTHRAALAMLCGGVLLMVAGLVLRFVSGAPLATVQLTLFFVGFYGGLYLIFAGAITLGRQR
jgi:hypothetical protein